MVLADPASVRRSADWGFYHRDMAEQPETASNGRRNGWTRPVAIPRDLDGPTVTKATGLVSLPPHVYWSGPDRDWDLDDRRQRAQVYEIVLTEGTEDDVRHFVDVDDLVELWDELWLSPHVRQA